MKYLIVIFFIYAQTATASEIQCRTNDYNVSYCKYEGKIQSLYINSENLFIVYFEKKVDLNIANKFGFDIKSDRGAALKITPENKSYATLMYKTLLEAKVNDNNVLIHMRDIEGDSLKIDRVWIK